MNTDKTYPVEITTKSGMRFHHTLTEPEYKKFEELVKQGKDMTDALEIVKMEDRLLIHPPTPEDWRPDMSKFSNERPQDKI